MEDALAFLREAGPDALSREQMAPLAEAFTERCTEQALSDEWQQAALSFCQHAGMEERDARCIVAGGSTMHIWPEGEEVWESYDGDEALTLCGVRLPLKGPGSVVRPLPRLPRGMWAHPPIGGEGTTRLSRCPYCESQEDGFPDCVDEGTSNSCLDLEAYTASLGKRVPLELQRGISHLRQGTIDGWLTPCVVQGALMDAAIERLTSPAGEDALRRTLGEHEHARQMEEAHRLGLPGVHALFGDLNELHKALQPLLPEGPGEYHLSGEAQEEFKLSSYLMALSYGTSAMEDDSGSS
jgi:hypothetical protein